MAITNFHTDWTQGSYEADRDLAIKTFENDPLRLQTTAGLLTLKPYFDEKAKNGGSIAIGYGFDLLVHSDDEINTYLIAIGLSVLTQNDVLLLDQARANHTASNIQSIASQLSSDPSSSLNLGDEPTATALLDKYIKDRAEVDVTNFLSSIGMTWGPSKERAALVSLAYGNSKLLGGGLADALTRTDPYEARAEAWYQIRYAHANQLWSRRYRESDLFGLYNQTPSTTTRDEAFAIYRMFTKHRDEILNDEAANPPGAGKAIGDELLGAANLLVAKYSQYITDPVRGGNNSITTTDIQVTSADKHTLNAQNSSSDELLIATDLRMKWGRSPINSMTAIKPNGGNPCRAAQE